MKKIILFFLLLLAISAASFSQQINPSPALTKEDYLQKCKQKGKAMPTSVKMERRILLSGIV